MAKIRPFHLVTLLTLFLVTHAFLFWHFGIRNLFDSDGYIQAGDFFLNYGELQDVRQVFYFTHIGLIAFFRFLFPNQIIPFLVFQCIISCLSMFALYKSTARIFHDERAGFFSAIVFLLWIDTIHWNITAMTESLSYSLAIFIIYRLLFFKGTRREYIWMGVLLAMALTTRPTGVIILLSAITFLLAYYWRALQEKRFVKLSLFAILIFAGCLGAYAMFSFWDFTDQYERGNIVTYMDVSKGTDVFEESLILDSHQIIRSDSTKHPIAKMLLFIADNPVTFIHTACLKILYLISGVRPYYSALHNVYTVCWMGLVYLFFGLGWLKANYLPLKIAILTMIFVNCGLVGISTVDWDNRFYIPMAPAIVLLAGGGCAFVFDFLKQKYVNRVGEPSNENPPHTIR